MYVALNIIDGTQMYGPFHSEEDWRTWHNTRAQVFDHDDLAREESSWSLVEVNYRGDDPHDTIIPTYCESRYFGNGRLEDITYEQWADGAVRLHGTIYVACGNGNVHYPDVNTGVVSDKDWGNLLLSTWRDAYKSRPDVNFKDLQYTAAGNLLDEELGESWTDPCERPDGPFSDEDESLGTIVQVENVSEITTARLSALETVLDAAAAVVGHFNSSQRDDYLADLERAIDEVPAIQS